MINERLLSSLIAKKNFNFKHFLFFGKKNVFFHLQTDAFVILTFSNCVCVANDGQLFACKYKKMLKNLFKRTGIGLRSENPILKQENKQSTSESANFRSWIDTQVNARDMGK